MDCPNCGVILTRTEKVFFGTEYYNQYKCEKCNAVEYETIIVE